jgi:hypothetical protein
MRGIKSRFAKRGVDGQHLALWLAITIALTKA